MPGEPQMLTWSYLWSLWMTDLARLIRDTPYHPSCIAEYNGRLMGRVWFERFGNCPTLGEIDFILADAKGR